MKINTELADYLSNLFGSAKDKFLMAKPEAKAIRINTLKISPERIKERLKGWQVEYSELPFNPHGLKIINDHIPLSHSIDFFLGYFQYQGIASQIPALVLDPQPGQKVLDICAAPGSKSTQMAVLMNNEGILVLNDISKSRLQSLNVNVQRAGIINQIILNLAGERCGQLFPAYFDKILVDAPCTALGTLANSPEVQRWWSIEKLSKLIASQKHILISAFKALKVGGELVYSTCSVAPEENELLMQWMLENYPFEVMDADSLKNSSFSAGLTSYQGQDLNPGLAKAVRVYPHIQDMEGFFVIKLRKISGIARAKMDFTTPGLPTLLWNDQKIIAELQSISDLWGIPEDIWQNYRYLRTAQRIWLMNKMIEQVPQEKFHNAGLLLAEKRISGWKLSNQSAQFFDHLIQKRRIRLRTEQMHELFKSGLLPHWKGDEGYYVLDWNGLAVASLYSDGNKIQLRIPHSFRLHL